MLIWNKKGHPPKEDWDKLPNTAAFAKKNGSRFFYNSTRNKKTGIICISGNWHGRTVGSQMLSGKNKQSEWIGYFDKSIHHIDFPYPWSLKSTKQTAKNKSRLLKFTIYPSAY